MKMTEAIPAYVQHLKVLGQSSFTLTRIKYSLKKLAAFLADEQIHHIEEITPEILAGYQEELAFCLTARGKPLSAGAQEKLLSAVKGFCRYLMENDYLVRDPAAKIKLPKKARRLPKLILSAEEVKKLMAAPDMRTHEGYRNRVILEILYDTGIRRSELAGIRLSDLDVKAGFALIHGKGGKDRVVPMSARVCELVNNYIIGVRPSFLADEDDGYLILNRWGKKMHHMAVYMAVRRCVELAGIRKSISTHTFRHTCATHMLKNGAPVRHVQELLGHESLESTQVYTRVTINDLKEIHSKYHPSGSLRDPV